MEDKREQGTEQEQTEKKGLSGWKIPASLIVAAALIVLVATALFSDTGKASAALVRAERAKTTYAAEESAPVTALTVTPVTAEEEETTRAAVYEEDAVVSDAAEETASGTVTNYDPALYLEAAQQINAYDEEAAIAWAEEQAAQQTYAPQPAWYNAPVYDEEAYTAPATDDSCIGDGLTY